VEISFIYGLAAILEGNPRKNTKIKNSSGKVRPIWLLPVTCCLFLTARGGNSKRKVFNNIFLEKFLSK
jgi:hypothetical protein